MYTLTKYLPNRGYFKTILNLIVFCFWRQLFREYFVRDALPAAIMNPSRANFCVTIYLFVPQLGIKRHLGCECLVFLWKQSFWLLCEWFHIPWDPKDPVDALVQRHNATVHSGDRIWTFCMPNIVVKFRKSGSFLWDNVKYQKAFFLFCGHRAGPQEQRSPTKFKVC